MTLALLRRPEADLRRLPVQMDLRAISLAEGVRAGLAVAALIVANEWIGSVLLIEAALGALLTCLCDGGGPIRRRVPGLLAFGILGALATAGFGVLRNMPVAVVVPIASFALFCTSFARVWGPVAMQVGNLLSVVIIIALTHQFAWAAALPTAGALLGGSLWALLLTMVIWRLYPYGPARRAVAECYRALAALAADLRERMRTESDAAAWEAHARAHRRAVRDALEAARQITLDAAAGRASPGVRLAQTVLRLEIAEQMFGALIAMADLLERERDPAVRGAADRILRLLRPALLVLAQATARDDSARTERLDQVVRQIEAAPPASLRSVTLALTERLRIAVTLAEAGGGAQEVPADAAGPSWRARVTEAVRANLGWDSSILRHAARVGVVAVPAFAFTLGWPHPYSYWLTIMLVLTLQPYFALTWQRALERIGGTVAGAFVAAALTIVCTTGLGTAAAFVPLAVLALAARRVSFAAFVSLLTPMIILLVELARPGANELGLTELRALYAAAGGLLAVAGVLVCGRAGSRIVWRRSARPRSAPMRVMPGPCWGVCQVSMPKWHAGRRGWRATTLKLRSRALWSSRTAPERGSGWRRPWSWMRCSAGSPGGCRCCSLIQRRRGRDRRGGRGSRRRWTCWRRGGGACRRGRRSGPPTGWSGWCGKSICCKARCSGSREGRHPRDFGPNHARSGGFGNFGSALKCYLQES